MNTSDSYARLNRVFTHDHAAYAEIDAELSVKGYYAHPKILQAFFDLIYLFIPVPEIGEGCGHVINLVACEELVTVGQIAHIAKAKFKYKGLDESGFYRADLFIYDEKGHLALMFEGLGFKLTNKGAGQ